MLIIVEVAFSNLYDDIKYARCYDNYRHCSKSIFVMNKTCS